MMNSQNGACGIEALEPAPVWRLFARLSGIPHPSKKEERIRAEVRAVAEEMGLSAREDAAGNILIDAPASPGCEGAPVTVLQGHLDMVCEKNADSTHNFDQDPIRLIVDRDEASGERIVRADGTTLGADNGVGVAMALAAASATDMTHGPLELLLTADEETGMTGANALTPESFRGRRLLNLDSEEDDALYIGCAGGCDTILTFSCELQAPGQTAAAYQLKVSGLRGGHSGGDIHENRGNAIKLLTRTLLRAGLDRFRVASIRGGQLRNAIPREAEAVVVGSADSMEALRQAAAEVQAEGSEESAEPDLAIDVAAAGPSAVPSVLSQADTGRVLATLAALPHGVLGMHRKMEGLVETSNNVATVRFAPDGGGGPVTIEIGNLSRSSSASRQREALDQLAAVGRLAGATVKTGDPYPGWAPNPDSPTLATCARVYRDLFGAEPRVAAIHAGLECGIIGERVGGVDMVSLGPTIQGAHSPDERVYVASVQKSWKFLQTILAELSKS
jgi:dipeptidase D